ncbi:hypothetical protein [Parvibaculum sp.]|uniref:hypothetical protein n=1 Tax=Parvibaculum sp. TaxID=2024848 RepID=UPI001B1B03EA|nr:hypothetical protein [Parvibaculum sp.]MBO6669610.1 hypothetical protein [Parvibaculum sp.]MBO6716092.1 hypothetical protein [Parvibaculum sp.]
MPEKKAKPKKKPDRKLSQKERFIEAARAAEADETGETFERTIEKIIPPGSKK